MIIVLKTVLVSNIFLKLLEFRLLHEFDVLLPVLLIAVILFPATSLPLLFEEEGNHDCDGKRDAGKYNEELSHLILDILFTAFTTDILAWY